MSTHRRDPTYGSIYVIMWVCDFIGVQGFADWSPRSLRNVTDRRRVARCRVPVNFNNVKTSPTNVSLAFERSTICSKVLFVGESKVGVLWGKKSGANNSGLTTVETQLFVRLKVR